MSTRVETAPNATNAYRVDRIVPKSPPEPLERRHAIAAAASPHRVEIVRDPGATSSRDLHCGHSMLLEYAAAIAAVISALQCGQMRTATVHLPVRTPNNKRNHTAKKRETRWECSRRASTKEGSTPKRCGAWASW